MWLVSGDLALFAVAELFVPVLHDAGCMVKHARYYWLLLAEGHLSRRLFGDMLGRIWALPLPSG
jgi:hypothetical protein